MGPDTGDPPAALGSAHQRRWMLALVAGVFYMGGHAAAVALIGEKATRLSFLVAALSFVPLVSMAFGRARVCGRTVSRRWLLWSCSLFLAMLEVLLATDVLPASLHFAGTLSLIGSFTLCLLIVASPPLPERSRAVQAIDLGVALAVCLVCDAAILLPQSLFGGPAFLSFLTVLRLIPAAAALLALRGARSSEDYILLRSIAVFQGLSLLSCAVLNQGLGMWLQLPGASPFDCLMDLPSIAGALLLGFALDVRFENQWQARFVTRSGMPIFLSITLVALSAWLIPHHRVLGPVGIAAGMLAYAARSTLVYGKALAAEESLRHTIHHLSHLAESDPLTSVANRRRFDRAIGHAWEQADPARPLALLLLDIDHFKQINDRLGHLYGDRCLRFVAEVLFQVSRRSDDLVCRFGGDEFALLLPNTDLRAALRIAERITERVRHADLEGSDGGPLTVSVGLAIGAETGDRSPEVLLREADENLYRAKRAGRDRACGPRQELAQLG